MNTRERNTSISTSSTLSSISHLSEDASGTVNETPLINHARSISDTSHVRPPHSASTEGVPISGHRNRGLEIQTSAKEGRRLVFSDATTRTTSVSDMPIAETPQEDQDDAAPTPVTPKKQKRSPRVVTALGLNTTPSGSAVVGQKEVLETDLGWLQYSKQQLQQQQQQQQHVRSESKGQSEDDVDGFIPAVSSTSKVEESLTASAKKKRRLEAFGPGSRARSKSIVESSSPLATPSKSHGKSSPASRHRLTASCSKVSKLHGYGRLAVGEELAFSFLGIDDPQIVAATPSSPLVSTELPDLSEQHESTHRSLAVPDWPDEHFPWSHEVAHSKTQLAEEASRSEAARLATLETYLDDVSEDDDKDDLNQGDCRLVLRKAMSDRGLVNLTSSDAQEAILHIKRNGRTLLERDIEAGISLPIISPGEEVGCVCRGRNEEGGGMVCCDGCSVWYHLSCCGIGTEDELEDQWFCYRCEPHGTSAIRGGGQASSLSARNPHATSSESSRNSGPTPVTPRMRHALAPTLSATDETTRSYHAHTSDAALAPSPTFSTADKFSTLLMDTPSGPVSFYGSPRVPSGSSSIMSKFTNSATTPGYGTPLMQPRLRVVSYAEHYNVCQTPGAPDSDYKKIYSTPKFEDFFDTGVSMPSGTTPSLKQPGSPTPLPRPRNKSTANGTPSGGGGGGQLAFTTPTSSQNFLRSLQSGNASASTPALEFLSSAGGPSHSPYPISPALSSGRVIHHPTITDSISPSPYRSHARQVSFGTRASNFTAGASQLRDSVTIKPSTEKAGAPLSLGGDLKELAPNKSIKGSELEFGEGEPDSRSLNMKILHRMLTRPYSCGIFPLQNYRALRVLERHVSQSRPPLSLSPLQNVPLQHSQAAFSLPYLLFRS